MFVYFKMTNLNAVFITFEVMSYPPVPCGQISTLIGVNHADSHINLAIF